MEFKFLGNDLKSPHFHSPFPIKTHFSVEPSSLLQGGFRSVFPVTNTEQILNPNVTGCEDILRKLEKERIKLEIRSSEIARRMMLEREVALRRSLGENVLLNEQVALGLNHRPNPVPPCDDPRLKPDPKSNKNKLIMLAKPNPDIYREKRKTAMNDDDDDDETEHSPIVVKKKLKDDWSCALCRVSVTSEKAFNEHIQGKKHKARVERMQNIGTSASPSSSSQNGKHSPKPTETIVTSTTSDVEAKVNAQVQPEGVEAIADAQVQPEVTKENINRTVVGKDHVELKIEYDEIVGKVQITEGSGKQNGTETEQASKIKSDAVNKGYKFWCELCQVGCCSVVVMENHKRGKKHINRLKRLRQNDKSAPPIPEATPLLTKDADGCPNE